MRWIGILAAACVVCAPMVADARYRQTAKVRYETKDGTSDWYKVDVNFMTGDELDNATKSTDYDMFAEYAVIFWDESQASVIKLNRLNGCSMVFNESCLPYNGKMRGNDQQDREWEICTGLYC